ncbi:hypothetical protein ACIQW9_02385 [Herminiimonas sp. NPDC097707]|uniref:hypothetical protein n=1 Tax=Herminiimonas sp. NPDC097707 TaxID=3364007 RepID=UPI003839DB6C
MSEENTVKAPARKAVAKKAVAKKAAQPAVKAVTAKPEARVTKSTFLSKTTPRKAAAPAVKKTVANTTAGKKPMVKPAKKSVAKPVTKSVKTTVAKAPQVAKPAVPTKEKVKKAKLVRDSFTMPEVEYQVLSDVKKAFLKSGVSVKKSELLRAGVALIKTMGLSQLNAVIAALAPIKAGRPKKDK